MNKGHSLEYTLSGNRDTTQKGLFTFNLDEEHELPSTRPRRAVDADNNITSSINVKVIIFCELHMNNCFGTWKSVSTLPTSWRLWWHG